MTRITTSNGRITVAPEVNVVASTAETVREDLMTVVNQNNAELVIDLRGVTRVDSIGVGVFIAIFNALKKREKKLSVINASKKIRSLFQTMGLARRFSIRG